MTLRNGLFSLTLLVTGLVLTATSAMADEIGGWVADEDATVQQLANVQLWVGGVAGIYYAGRTSEKVYGVAVPGTSAPPQMDASYEIGSITKSFTGILLALATAEIPGLTVDSQLGKFLPEVRNSYVEGLTGLGLTRVDGGRQS